MVVPRDSNPTEKQCRCHKPAEWLSEWLFAKALGMSNATMAPQGRDITNLSPLFFPWRLTTGAHWRIFSHSLGQNCSALLSFQLFKRSHEEEDKGEKILVFSHRTADKSPRDASVVLENNAFFPLFVRLTMTPHLQNYLLSLYIKVLTKVFIQEDRLLNMNKQSKRQQTTYLKG